MEKKIEIAESSIYGGIEVVYRILSLDGGGIKGAFTLQLLKLIEKDVGKKFLKNIDCYAGTSTGALIALSMILGYTPRRVLLLYRIFGRRIFKAQEKRDPLAAKYETAMLRKALLEVMPEEQSFADLDQDLIIPVCRLLHPEKGKWAPEVYDTYDKELAKRHLLVDVAIRTSSAPLYFPSHQGRVDGGFYALNPALLALSSAIDPAKGAKSIQDIRLLSLGTGKNPVGISGDIDWGTEKWMKSGQAGMRCPLISLFLDMGSESPDYPLNQLLGDQYLRMNGELHEPIEIDETRKIKDLIREANTFKKEDPKRWNRYKEWIVANFIDR